MIGISSHLRDGRLFDCYLSARVGESLDPRSAEHLSECAECAARFDELALFMDGLREGADRELDEAFSADVLRQQRQSIARRISSVGRSARVIHFPSPEPAWVAAPRKRPRLPRWAAATAAAGLFIGVAAGLFFKGGATPLPTVSVAVDPPLTQHSVGPELFPTVPDPDRDDRFLNELEVAADGPRTAELAAFDALTPHIREVSLSMTSR